ncbi:MAG: hypothetical protein R8J85_02330 [Mariprofundales bacterium]
MAVNKIMASRLSAWMLHGAVLAGILLLILIVASAPIGIERDTDEGLHLMMAWLYHQGFSFFDQILYDHFPLFDVMLSYWMSMAGFTYSSAQGMVILLSSLLSWFFYLLIAMRYHWSIALAATTLLFCSDGFLLATGSLLQALPWITFGLASLLVLRWGNASLYALIFSACLMAMAIQIKLFAVLMLPAMVLDIFQTTNKQPRSLLPLFYWSVTLFFSSLLLLWFTAPSLTNPDIITTSIHYLVDSHVGMDHYFLHNTLWGLLQNHHQDFILLVLAIIGLLLAWRMDGEVDWFPLVWLACNGVALLLIHPVWYHYYTMLSIPIVWLAANAMGSTFTHWNTNKNAINDWLQQGVGVALWFLLITLPFRFDSISEELTTKRASLDAGLIQQLKTMSPTTTWLVTDRPGYPFRAHINVPPELVVTSLTLMRSGMQNAQSYLKVIDRYHPEVVLLARFRSLRSQLKAPLQKRGYLLVSHRNHSDLYHINANKNDNR